MLVRGWIEHTRCRRVVEAFPSRAGRDELLSLEWLFSVGQQLPRRGILGFPALGGREPAAERSRRRPLGGSRMRGRRRLEQAIAVPAVNRGNGMTQVFLMQLAWGRSLGRLTSSELRGIEEGR